MARVFTSGAELQSTADGFEFDYAVGGGSRLTIDTSIKRTGNASYKMASAAATATYFARYALAADGVLFMRFYIYIQTLPSTNSESLVEFYDATETTSRLSIAITTTGALQLHKGNIASTQIGSDSAPLSTNTWYRIELKAQDGGSPEAEARIDGVVFASGSDGAYNFASGMFYLGPTNGDTAFVVNYDDVALNDNSGTAQTSYPGEGRIVLALPTGAGDSAATTGIFSYINEIPPSNTATSGSTMIELDANPTNGEYAMTDSSTLGIAASDTITLVAVYARIREETAGTSNYMLRLKSASGGTTSVSSSVDAGDTTPRTNPSTTTSFGNSLISYTDPTTGAAWTPTGTNSIDNMQAGVGTTDGAPDTWCLWLGAYIEYVVVAANAFAGRRMLMGVGT